MLFIQLSDKFSRVQPDSLEARLRLVEQPDKPTPRGTLGLLRGNPVSSIICVID